MKVEIDLTKCKACGRCYDFASDVFERRPTGQSRAIRDAIPEDALDLMSSALAASNICPMGAISLEEDGR